MKHMHFCLIALTFLVQSSPVFAASGSISVQSDRCAIDPGDTYCDIIVSWTSSGNTDVCLWRTGSGLTPAKFSCATSKTNLVFPYGAASGRNLELRANNGAYSTSTLLDSQFVFGVFMGGINPGGSSYGWHQIDSTGCSNNDALSRADYDVVSTFHESGVSGKISQHFDQMRSSGQSSIRIPIYFKQCGEVPSGDQSYSASTCAHRSRSSSVASELGRLPLQAQENVFSITSLARSKGFTRIVVAFLPQAANHPSSWEQFDNTLFEQNWAVIKSTKDFIRSRSTTLDGKILWELSNELTPAPNLSSATIRRDYGKKLWSRWVNAYGRNSSTGFSTIASSVWHVRNRTPYLKDMYGSQPPPVFDFHIYSQCSASQYPSGSSCDTEREILNAIAEELEELAAHTGRDEYRDNPIVIGESWYSDLNAAASISAGQYDIIREIDFVLQWPRRRGAVFNCFVAPPSDYRLDSYSF